MKCTGLWALQLLIFEECIAIFEALCGSRVRTIISIAEVSIHLLCLMAKRIGRFLWWLVPGVSHLFLSYFPEISHIFLDYSPKFPISQLFLTCIPTYFSLTFQLFSTSQLILTYFLSISQMFLTSKLFLSYFLTISRLLPYFPGDFPTISWLTKLALEPLSYELLTS